MTTILLHAHIASIQQKKTLSFSRTSSSNLMRHMKSKHKIIYDKFLQSKRSTARCQVNQRVSISPKKLIEESKQVAAKDEIIEVNQCEKEIEPEKVLFKETNSVCMKNSIDKPVINDSSITALVGNSCNEREKPGQILPGIPQVLESSTVFAEKSSTFKTEEHSDTSKAKQTQLIFKKPECSVCHEIKYIKKWSLTNLNIILADCNHNSNDCCCKTASKSFLSDEIEVPQSCNSNIDNIEDTFVYQFDSVKNAAKVFCLVCLKYGQKKTGRKRPEDYSWETGIIFNSKRREKQDKSRHLQSVSHKAAVNFLDNDTKEQLQKGLPTVSQQKKCTENAMIAAMFMINHNLAHRVYPHLCAFISLIVPTDLPHPLGNRHQAHNSVKKILEANFEAVITNLKQEFSKTLVATNSTPRITVSVDKGTAPKDVTRQAVVVTLM